MPEPQKPRRFRYDPELKLRARQLRRNSTLGEVMLWGHLRCKQRMGYDFHRQKPVAHWILDFFCPALNLAIEVDGSSHDYNVRADTTRQKAMEGMGIRFVRFDEEYLRENSHLAAMWLDEWIRKNA